MPIDTQPPIRKAAGKVLLLHPSSFILHPSSFIFLREPAQAVAREPKDAPVLHRLGAEPAVEPDRGLVPVEHRPLQPAAGARGRPPCHLREQFPAKSPAAPMRLHE